MIFEKIENSLAMLVFQALMQKVSVVCADL